MIRPEKEVPSPEEHKEMEVTLEDEDPQSQEEINNGGEGPKVP